MLLSIDRRAGGSTCLAPIPAAQTFMSEIILHLPLLSVFLFFTSPCKEKEQNSIPRVGILTFLQINW